MQLSVIQLIRTQFAKLTHPVYMEDGTELLYKPAMLIIFKNGVDKVVDRNDGTTVWDDDNKILYSFSVNTPTTTDIYSMNKGGKVDKVMNVMVEDYEEISRIQIVINEDQFDKLATELSLPATQVKTIKNHIFKEADLDYQLEKKQEVGLGYSNLHTKKYNKGISLTGLDEYSQTVHIL